MVVRVFERSGTVRVVMMRGPDKPEVVEFEGGTDDVAAIQSVRGYYAIFSRLHQQGYVLQSTIPGTSSGAAAISTMIFVKASKPGPGAKLDPGRVGE
ncbi:hypothetical protein GCM10027346_42810 [Hymenobacter seoulensis]